MKIVCDCGNELELKPSKVQEREKFYIYYNDIALSITCKNCEFKFYEKYSY